MPNQSRRHRDKASRPPQHQASPSLHNGDAPKLVVKLRVPTMEGNPVIKQEPSSASASPPIQPAPDSQLDVIMTEPCGSSTPAPMKRSNSDRDDDEGGSPPASKRTRTASPSQDIPQKPTPEVGPRSSSPTLEERISAVPYTEPFFDDEPTRLLKRSIAVALSHVGFDSASKEAMDAFCSEANSCMCMEPVLDKRRILIA